MIHLRSLPTLACYLALCGCVDQTPGTEVTVDVLPPEAISFVTSEGDQVSLEQAWLTLGGMEFVACETLSTSLSRTLRGLWPIGTAHAHIDDAPNRISSPLVVDLAATQEPAWFGSVTPPADRYCGLDIWIIPADEDSRGLPEDARMDTRTFLLRGSWSPAGSDAPSELRVIGADSAIVHLSFESPMELSREQRRASLTLQARPARWFRGLSLATTGGVEQSRAIMENIAAGFELHVNWPEN